MTRIDADVTIVGSGFAGSLTALALRQRGHRVALVERGRHPRFAIGESSTPLANLLIEELADLYDLPRVKAFSKWGSWQRERPQVAAGLKRGFTFFFHNLDAPFRDGDHHERQLMVAASPHDEIADTHWYRPDFDGALVEDARAAGAIYLDATRIDSCVEDADGQLRLEAEREGRPIRIDARFVVDASGPRGFLHRVRDLGELPLRWLPPTQGLFTHFRNVERWDRLRPEEGAPFPADDAALHHVFPGGWIWMLRFNNGITSAGAALTDALAGELDAAAGEPAWRRLLGRLPSVREQFTSAEATMPFAHVPRLGFRSSRVAGANWALLPSAAGVIDPLLSTGFPLTLLGVLRLVGILDSTKPGSERETALSLYERTTMKELDATERLVGALYAVMHDPSLFKRLSLLYFAAASFSETARRLGRAELAPGFLLTGNATFAEELTACAGIAAGASSGIARDRLLERIDRAIQPFDVAGLGDRSRRDWYPVNADDLVRASAKVGASPQEVSDLLRRTGMMPPVSVSAGATSASGTRPAGAV